MSLDILLKADWKGGIDGKGRIEAADAAFDISIPKSYGGIGTDTNPKELFVAAIQACFIATLRGITLANKLPVEHLSVQTKAAISEATFEVQHQAEVVLTSGSSQEDVKKAEVLIQRAEAICEVGNLARQAGAKITATPVVKIV